MNSVVYAMAASALDQKPERGPWVTAATNKPTSNRNCPGPVSGGDGLLHFPGRSAGTDHDVYDPVLGTWTTKAPLPVSKTYSGAAEWNGRLYSWGGNNGSTYHTRLDVWDPATNMWTALADMPAQRQDFAYAAAGGYLYTFCGYTSGNGNNRTAACQRYNIATNTWTSDVPAFPGGSFFGMRAAVAEEGLVYVSGGYNGTASFALFYAYDPVANSWAAKADVPYRTHHHYTAAYRNEVHVWSGSQDTAIRTNHCRYRTASNSWDTVVADITADPNAAQGDDGGGACCLNGHFWFSGGDFYPNSLFRYQVQTDMEAAVADLLAAIAALT